MLARQRRSFGDQIGRGAFEHEAPAVVARSGAEIDDPVGVRHHRQVVLDHDDRLTGVDQAIEQPEQLLEIGEVQPGGRLVEHVHAAPQVAETHARHALEDRVRRGCLGRARAEEADRLVDREIEHLGDVELSDDAGPVARRAGALGVGAEQRRLHAVLLGERLPDRLDLIGVLGFLEFICSLAFGA